MVDHPHGPRDEAISPPHHHSPASDDRRRAEDRNLARAVVAGNIDAWHVFIDRYTALIYSVLRRYSRDPETLRNMYAVVLESLYKKKLSTFEGRSAMSTWLVVVTRSIALDYLRKTRNRTVPPHFLDALSVRDRMVFELYFEQNLTLSETCRRLAGLEKGPVDADSVVDSLERLDEVLDPRTRRRLAYRRRAASLGISSSRLLEFLDQHLQDQQDRASGDDPEARLLDQEGRRYAARVLALTGRLSAAEQRLLKLRFEENCTAKEIAKALDIQDPKVVYRMTERCLRRLGAWARALKPPVRKRPGDVVQ